jgi:menaquinone-specific isochorismate synthase
LNTIPHHAHEDFGDRLRWRLEALLCDRRPVAAPGLLSITLSMPDFRLECVPALREGDIYWAHHESGNRLFGRGLALHHAGGGGEGLVGLRSRFRDVRVRWRHLDMDGCNVQPQMFVGFAFDPADPMAGGWEGFPNSGLFLPELLLRQQGDSCHLVLSCRDGLLDERRQVARWLELLAPILDRPVEPGAGPRSFLNTKREPIPANTQWLALARDALDSIEQGVVDKLVLHRRLRLDPAAGISARSLAAAMEAAYPGCRLFAMVRNGRTLLSASPEQLLEKRGQRLSADVLAGTAPRSSNAVRDRHLAQSLRHSRKERLEHQLVEDAVVKALAPLCSEMRTEAAPRLQRLRNVQHLWSRVHGELSGPENLLDAAARLHPTPAVGGSPGPVALDWLRSRGQAQRGWYCGGGGWIDSDGEGELAVLLRCALVASDGGAELFAGAGLVRGSDPAAELAETDLKLAAVLDLFGNARGPGLV